MSDSLTNRKSALLLEAGNGARTRDPQLGKLMLYQLSYPRTQTGFYPAQDLPAPGIYNSHSTDGRRHERAAGDRSNEDG
jgi:hypothetical protein